LSVNAARPSTSSASTQEFINASLQTLVRAVRAILSTPPEPTPESLQALYSLCEGLVASGSSTSSNNNNISQTLYERIKIEIERKVGETATGLRNLDTSDGEAWLQALDTAWKAYTEKLVGVNSLFGLVGADYLHILSHNSFLSDRSSCI
jgi:cullin-4